MDNMDNFEDKTIIAPTTPHNQGYEEPSPEPEGNSSADDSLSKVEYLKGLKVLFKDPNAKNNLLLGFIFALIPIAGNLALLGWFCEIMQRSLRKHPTLVPKLSFSDFGHYLSRGIVPFLILFLGYFAYMIVYIAGSMITGIMMNINETIGIILFIGLYAFLFVGGFLFFLVINTPVTFGEISENFSKALDRKKIISYLKVTWVKFLIGFIIISLISTPLIFVGFLLCGVGLFLSTFIITFTSFFIRLQIYHYYLAQGGEPVEVKPEQKLPSEQALAANPS